MDNPFLIRVTRKLTGKEKEKLRLALYWCEHMTVATKESFIDGNPVPFDGWEVYSLIRRAENSGLQIKFERRANADTAAPTAMTEAEHGIY